MAPSLVELQLASSASIRSGFFQRLYLYDQAGLAWQVERLEQTGSRRVGPFGGLLEVRLTLTQTRRREQSEVVDDLCRILDSDDDVYSQTLTHAQAAASLRAATGPRELIARVAEL